MASTFSDASGTVYTPAIVNVLSWKYSPNTVVHKIINPSSTGAVITNIGPGVMTGSMTVVFDDAADADAFANVAVLGVEFRDPDHFLDATVVVATGDIEIEQDDDTRDAFTVAFAWGVLS